VLFPAGAARGKRRKERRTINASTVDVDTYLSTTMAKRDVQSRSEALQEAIHHGSIMLED